MSFLGRLFGRSEPQGSHRDNPVFDAISRGECPDCGGTEFFEGPSGGLCTNYKCADCGSRFNIGGSSGRILFVERI